MATLIDLLEGAVERNGERPALSVRRDDGTTETWSYRELDRRTKLAAYRLRALGLEPGDRIVTWSPSRSELAATYFGAMRARLIFVPLDLRMSADAISRVRDKSGAKHLVIGSGRDAPDPRDAGLEHFPMTTVEALAAPPFEGDAPGRPLPDDWEAQVEAWPKPAPDDVFELIFTSGTTGAPKGVMLAHDNVSASIASFHRIIPPLAHRIVSLLPLSHLLEQSVALYYATSVGAHVLYPRSLNPRVLFEAFRELRVTSMVVAPQLLDLFWSGIEREVDKTGRRALFDRLRGIARHLPLPVRRLLFRSLHRQLGGEFRLFVSAGAFLPPALQGAWEDIGVIVMQGYGTSETGTGACTTLEDHGLGTVGRPPAGIEMRLADDGEVQFRGETLFKGYWDEPGLTETSYTPDGWFKTGDVGHLDSHGRLILSGRKKDMIVLPNGFNVYPEDIENALRIAGIRDSVVVETRPGRIEAIVLAPGHQGPLHAGRDLDFDPATPPEAIRAELDGAVKAANASLGANQRIAAWRLWPEADFPRTHTFKVRRDPIRAWARVENPVVVRTD
jgi:long-chain acyl-CoA synthetase